MCPKCRSLRIIRKGVRRGRVKYFCKACTRWFQINRKEKLNTAPILISHLCGESFRSLAERNGSSAATVFRRYNQALAHLPHCADLTRAYCSRFCGVLLVDGKYVSVKGYGRKYLLFMALIILLMTYQLIFFRSQKTTRPANRSLLLLGYLITLCGPLFLMTISTSMNPVPPYTRKL